ncbi:hypothetical protein EIP86_000407 [Pleurotus ostreatoroseus]|nr:hypothetical protein EIP86_000407 [Pleurotus ostreatoroseus]
MDSSIPTRRGPPYAAASIPPDEDFINRSLLDSVIAQGDAEPVLSASDIEVSGASVSAFGSIPNASAVGSTSIPYHRTIQPHQQSSHPDSPGTTNMIPSYLQSPPLNAEPYSQGQSTQQLYNSVASLSSTEQDALNPQPKANGFSSAGTFRNSAPFSAFTNSRPRPSNASYRDTPSNYTAPSFAPTQTDVYITSPNGPQSPTGPQYEPIHHPGRYDFGLNPSQSAPSLVANGQSKQSANFSAMDAYRLGLEPTMPLAQQMKPSAALNGPPGLLRDTQTSQLSLQQSNVQQGFQAQPLNGMSHPLAHQLQNQAYGVHGPVNGTVNGGQGAAGPPGPQSSSQPPPQEEISTIFVVGFPDDMSEREFQNMFTFSNGFEAATLKIPNRDYNASNGSNLRNAALPVHYGGSNDPYNIVTVNQGGVVVDGRDGTTSWPAPQMSFLEDGHFVPSTVPVQPPRKQIIGFAKFRTRQEALEARDLLQGRRVDIEKGSVLKAEMAKKNLHTKRGPGMGPMGVNSVLGGAAMQPDSLTAVPGLGAASNANEVFMQREKELGLGPMTIAGLGQRRALGDNRDDLISMATFATRGARERAEEDERERKRKEKEAQRLRQNSFAFEAFHSVPAQMVRQGANSLLSVENGAMGPALPEQTHSLSAQSSMQSLTSQGDSGPWPTLRDVDNGVPLRKLSAAASSLLPPRPPSTQQEESPINGEAAPSPPSGAASLSGSTNPSAPFSPQSTSSMLPSYGAFQPGHRASSPSAETYGLVDTGSLPTSSASSANGGHGLNGDDLARAVGVLAVSTDHEGTISPQLPSPASNSSSGHGRNPGDQNPPVSVTFGVWRMRDLYFLQINTLYVGNLPSSPSPGGSPPAMLEDRLRDLFSKRPGYRKLCFRQKSNGPMCFVEFEDVAYATKALNELHGDTLGGLVKGGIRLSYSKNPLGVRTPTSGGNGQSLQQQQVSQQAFYSTQNAVDDFRTIRRDTSGMTSPTNSYYYAMSSPPPRFAASPPSFPSSLTNASMFPRASPQGFSLSSGISSAFSPFGISPSHSSIPDQPSADPSNDQFKHTLSSANVEASRAG